MRRLAAILVAVVVACGDPGTAPTSASGQAPTTVPAATMPASTSAAARTTSAPAGDRRGYDLQGHRGARGLRPENTLPSFEAALDLEVTTLELDLHLSADGQVVVWHDPSVEATKCGLGPGAPAGTPDPDDPSTPPAALMVAALTAVQLGHYRCARNPDPGRFPDQDPAATTLAGDDYRIVTLAEVIDFAAAYAVADAKTPSQRAAAAVVRFNVETKRVADDPDTIGDGFDGVQPGPFERAIAAIVAERGLEDRVIVQSFDHRSLWALRTIAPGVRLAALTRRGGNHADLAARGAAIWSPNYESVDAGSLQRAHDAGLAVIPWTVNDPEEMQRLVELGVDGVITDRPDLAP